MSLKPTLENLDGLHEEVAKLYVKKDGKFVLDVEDSGLKSALQKERDAREAAETALKERDKAAEEDTRKKAEEEAIKRGEFDKVIAEKENRASALAKELADTKVHHEIHLKQTKALTLLGPVAANAVSLEDLSRRFMDRLEVKGEEVKVKGFEGTPEQFAEKFLSSPDLAVYLKPSGANGGGSSNHQGGGATGTHARHKELSDKPTLSPSESRELLVLAGQIQNETKS